MSRDVTVCTVAYNAAAAVELMWESYRYRHRSVGPLFAHDNGSTDGAAEYLKTHADKFVQSVRNVGHGPALNDLCAVVTTPYTLVCDTDVEFFVPVVDRLIAELEVPGVGGVCYPSAAGRATLGPCKFGVTDMLSLARIDPCCAMFRTADLQRWLRATAPTGWGMHVEPAYRLLYDCGAVVRSALEADGFRLAQPAWLGADVRHWGGVTCMFVVDELPAGQLLSVEPNPDTVQAARRDRYRQVKQQLAELKQEIRCGQP